MAKNYFENWQFKKITMEMMMGYIAEHAPADKAWFKGIALGTTTKKKSIPLFNDDGTPLMKWSNKKQAYYHAHKMVAVDGGETIATVNVLDAKYAFCERDCPALLPKAKEKKTPALDALANW